MDISFNVSLDQYELVFHAGDLPFLHAEYTKRAKLVDQFELEQSKRSYCFFAVGPSVEKWPSLVIEQRFDPSGYGFYPGVLFVPETEVLFVGAGTRLLCYNLSTPSRLWEDTADIGFQHWRRHGAIVLLEAETEFAAWDLEADKLWTTWVEPPWDYKVVDGLVHLNIMGKKSSFPVTAGPE